MVAFLATRRYPSSSAARSSGLLGVSCAVGGTRCVARCSREIAGSTEPPSSGSLRNRVVVIIARSVRSLACLHLDADPAAGRGGK